MEQRLPKSFSRRSFLRMSGAGIAATALAACVAPAVPGAPAPGAGEAGAQQQAAGEQTFLNYWTGWSGFEFDELQRQVDAFNEANQDEIYVNMTTVFGQYDKVLTAIAGGNPPDVVSAVWLHQLVSMAARNGLQPVTSYAERDGVTGEGYFPQLWDAWHWNGELWGLMITSNSNVIAYRPDLMTEVGLDADNPPQALDELDAAAQALEVIGSDGTIERVGLLPESLYWWGRVFGGQFYDESSGQITANDERIVAALDWMASYRERLDPGRVAAFQSGFGDYMSTQNPLFAGKEAMKQVGEWFIQFNRRFAPDLEIRMMPAPPPEGGRANCTTFGGSVFTIPTGAKTPDASWEFIKFVSQDEIMGEFCYNIFNIPPKVAPASEERFTSEPGFALAVQLLNGENAFGPDKIPVNDFLFTRLGEAETSVFAGETSAQEVLDRVTEEVQQELDTQMERLQR
ncbi:MAG: hypothetical protein DCC55_26685 [Chloroflexi bacterium]|nr:MAG: hypothetical protein DCC55_26685 [Chloroflexota bacterium]